MAERIKSNFTPFKKGQMVWLDLKHLKTNYHKKMAPKRQGPFEIEEVLGLVTYQLKLLNHGEFTKFSMQCYSISTKKMKSTEKIMFDHCQK
jgi:hypothetical protein